ncbi:MAG: zinc transporter ZupT [Mycoplasmatales bacterium]
MSFKETNKIMLSLSLSFSAGVMIYVSFMEILPKASIYVADSANPELVILMSFFIGIILMVILDCFLPEVGSNSMEESLDHSSSLRRMGLFTMIVIALHNFPEGMITFFSVIDDPIVGISIGIAIFIHNVPEGMAIATPIYHGTKSMKKALFYSGFAGLAEPIGGLLGYLLLLNYMNNQLLGIVFSLVAGIMIYISFDELLPASKKHSNHHISIIGLFFGMLVMGISLVLL